MATTYLSGTGSDADDGLTELTPKRTLAAGTPIANNDIIRIRRGTSVELTANKYPAGNLTVEAYGPESDGLAELLIPGGTYQFAHLGAPGTIYTARGLRATNTGAVGVGSGFIATQGSTLILEDFAVESPFQHGVRVGYGAGHRVRRGRISQVRSNGVYVGMNGQVSPSGGIYERLTIDASLCAGDGLTLHDGNSGGVGNVLRYLDIIGGVEECIDVQAPYADTAIYGCTLRASLAQGSAWAVVVMQGSGRISHSRLYGGVAAALKLNGADGVVADHLLILAGAAESNAQGVMLTNAANVDLQNLTIVSNAAALRSMVYATSTVGWTLKNSLLVQAAGDANRIFTTSGADPAAGAVDGNYYWLNGEGPNSFNGGSFAAWQAAHDIDAASTASTASPLMSAAYTPLPGSPLLTQGADLGYIRDIRGFQSRKHIGAYGAARLRSV